MNKKQTIHETKWLVDSNRRTMEYFEDSDPPPNAETGCEMPFPDGHYPKTIKSDKMWVH